MVLKEYDLIDRIKNKEFSLKEDLGETKRVFLKGGEEILGLFGCTVGYGMGYALSPFVVAGFFGARALKDHGAERDKSDWITPKTFREKLNRSVKDYGNNLTPRLKQNVNYGLGDLLTEDVNFRRVGAVTGALALPVAMYSSFSDFGTNPIKGVFGTAAYTAIMGPFSLMFSVIGSTAGYILGNKVDELFGQGAKEKVKDPTTYIAENMGA